MSQWTMQWAKRTAGGCERETTDLVIWKELEKDEPASGEDALTLVEFYAEVCFDVEFLWEVVLVKEGMDDVSERRRSSEWSSHEKRMTG